MISRLKAFLKKKLRNAVGFSELMGRMDQMDRVESQLHYIKYLFLHEHDHEKNRQDLLILLNEVAHFLPAEPFAVETAHPLACESNDHLHPWGTKNDNTRHPRFVLACERHFPAAVATGDSLRPGGLKYLDLGCSGGGLVWEFLLRGHEAVGVEGSDYSQKKQRAEWRLLGKRNLFTADITKPFQVRQGEGESFTAHVVTAWEVMEHIPQEALPQVFENVYRHLEPGGYFLGSIALFDDVVHGVSYHPTVESKGWWREKFAESGLIWTGEHAFEFGDFCRGVGNGWYDGNFLLNPEQGFHFVATRN